MNRSFANTLVRVLLAPACASCRIVLRRPLHGQVCDACLGAIVPVEPPWCAQCGEPLHGHLVEARCARCRASPRAFSVARSAGLYEGVLRQLVHQLKYGKRRPLARLLGALAADAGRQVLAGATAVVPVPLHPTRQFTRGFNQADDLATNLGLPVWRVLRRRRGPAQARLPADRRHENVSRAFACRQRHGPKAPAAMMRGQIVVLVDDVLTTGETADACSRALLEAGASEVRVLTVARAAAERPPEPRPPPLPWTRPRQ